MKILMLTPYLPYPLLSGGQIRSYNLLKNLAQKHEITLIALIKHDNEKQYIKNISAFCSRVIVCKRPEKPWTMQNILKTGFGKYPFLVVRNFSSEAKNAVVEELEHQNFDLIHAETFYVMPHIPETSVPILLVEQTIEYLVYQHFVETMGFPPLRFLFSFDVAKIRYWEEYYWKRASRVVAMSLPDKQIMEKVANLEVSIVPNGVDTTVFSFQKKRMGSNPKILFVGNFKWLQNREAAKELIHNIWPLIQQQIPAAQLLIVGHDPSPDILKFKSKNVQIAESMKDIRVAYRQSDVLLAPIFGPGGTRYKILESMATGLPVITTPQGIEGLGVTDGKEALVRSNSKSLSQATVAVLTDQKKYEQLARNANLLVRENYSWPIIAEALDSIYEAVARKLV